jgi:hypothetical protein
MQSLHGGTARRNIMKLIKLKEAKKRYKIKKSKHGGLWFFDRTTKKLIATGSKHIRDLVFFSALPQGKGERRTVCLH